MTRLSLASLMLAFFLLVDKALAVFRQVVFARQFGFSSELDAFNVANNIPDLLFAVISGGALSVAFIPVLSEVLEKQGRPQSWKLFSNIVNLAFVVTGAVAIIVFVLADPVVRIIVAPGFDAQQQDIVITLMRLNLISTLIFSISGLVMASLQTNQHFLLPALAPIFYNVGQILGALFLASPNGISLGGLQIPGLGLGVYGLVYGVILGALLHLGIQVPGLIRFKFRWSPGLGLNTPEVRRVLRIMGPRVLAMLAYQLVFIVRDQLGSFLDEGSVSALTYGWSIMQLPETVMGTAIGIAILPTLAELAAKEAWPEFVATIQRAARVLITLTLPVAAVLVVGLGPLTQVVFRLPVAQNELLVWVSRAYLLGLTGHCLLELGSRSFYARQNARVPMFASFVCAAAYTLIGLLFVGPLGAVGLGLADTLAFTLQGVLLLLWFKHSLKTRLDLWGTLGRAALAGALAGGVALVVMNFNSSLVGSVLAMALGMLVTLPLIWKQIRMLVRL